MIFDLTIRWGLGVCLVREITLAQLSLISARIENEYLWELLAGGIFIDYKIKDQINPKAWQWFLGKASEAGASVYDINGRFEIWG